MTQEEIAAIIRARLDEGRSISDEDVLRLLAERDALQAENARLRKALRPLSTTDLIRAALDKATRNACGCDCESCQPECRAQVAEEIAAFFRALRPDVTFQFKSGDHRTALDAFADAVLAAAKGDQK
jgi:hypothetical protein